MLTVLKCHEAHAALAPGGHILTAATAAAAMFDLSHSCLQATSGRSLRLWLLPPPGQDSRTPSSHNRCLPVS
jgi:hypothetical protein